ncbi:MAG: hypothetical protein JW955_15500, partial [Sedimentisphaerales bacterium]|nr:hypothetical protein [Sedimentisphaerales bacterium]
ITITDGGEDGSLPDDVGFGDEPTDATISEKTLENTASGSNAQIVLEARNDIAMEKLTDNELTLSSGVSLVLRTRNSLAFDDNVDGGITMDQGDSIVASGRGDITLQAGHDGETFMADSSGRIVAGSLTTNGGSVTVQAAGSVDVRRVSTAGAANSAGGAVLLEASKSMDKSALTVENGINTNGGPDADGSGANAAGPVTLSGTTVRISGSVTAVGGDDNGLDAQGGAGGPVTFNGATYLEHASVNSSGGAGNTPGNGGAIAFNGRLYLGGDSTLTAGTGNVTFHGQVDDLGDPNTGEPSGLSINSAGVTRFDAVVGGSWPLGSLTTDAPGRTEINANITTGAAEGVPATQTYNDPVVTTNDLVLEDLGTGGISFKSSLTLGGDLTVAAENGDVTFLGTVDDDDGSPLPDAGLLVHSAGITRFSAAVGGIHPIGHLYTDAPGTTEIGANITTNWTALYDDPVVLTNDVALTNWGTSGIRFNSTVSGNGQGPWDLTVAGPGSAEFLDTVTLGGGDLNVTAGWYITAYDVTTRGGVNTNGGNVSLTSLGGDVSVHGTIDTSGGNAVSSAVGPDAGGVAIESQAPEGTVTVHDIIAEGGNTDVTYAEGSVGDYAVGGDGGSVSISGARINADGFITTGQGLGITTITRTDDGGAVLPPLVYAMDGAGGSVQINGPLALDGDLTITAGTGDVVFLGPIDAMYGEGLVNANLMVNSASMTRFESPVGQQYPIESLTTDWPGWTEISANITTGGAGGGAATQTYNDPVVMTNNVELMDLGADGIYFNDSLSLGGDLHVTAVNGDVRFQGTIDDDGISETSSVLYVESGRTTRFNAPVGGSHPIDSLWTRTSLGAGAQATTYINGNITTRDGIQMYYHPVILENSVTLTDTGTNGIYFTDPVSGDGQGPWNLAVVTTDPQAQIQFNGPVTLDGGLRANAAGDIYANQLTSARNNIELRSTQGDLRLYGPINADRDGQGYGGGVSLIADSGRVHNGDGFLDVAITGYSDGTRGVDLPYGRGKAAIRIDSAEDLTLGSNCVLTARGVYSGRRIDLGTASDLYPDGFWARTMTYYDDDNPRPMDWAYASNVDDRSSVGFRTDSYYGGMPMDVAVYLCSSTGEVRIDSPAMVPDGATVVVDAYDAYTFDDMFTIGSEFPSTSRLEVVLRGAPDAGTPQEESDWLDGFTGYSAVLRSGALATVGQTQEWWQGPQEPSPPPLPVLIVPPVVPPIVLERPEGPDWLRLAEGVVGPIVPPSPDCVDVKETEIELLRKCQVACDLFSTDVSLVPTAEDIVTLDRRLKTRLEEILPRLSALSRKWPQPGKADLPAIEDVLQRDEALGGWLHDGVELVEIAKKKLRPTSTSDLVGGIVRMYLGSADGLVRDFVRAYFRSKLAAAAEQTTPRA